MTFLPGVSKARVKLKEWRTLEVPEKPRVKWAKRLGAARDPSSPPPQAGSETLGGCMPMVFSSVAPGSWQLS